MTEEERDALERVTERAVNGLMEHFQVVQVFVCTHLPAGNDTRTLCYRKGDGNYFARYGMVRQWLVEEERAASEADDGD